MIIEQVRRQIGSGIAILGPAAGVSVAEALFHEGFGLSKAVCVVPVGIFGAAILMMGRPMTG